jgi:hypothetical protein
MNTVFIVGSALLGLLPFIVSPTKTFARGGVWKYVGAALIVVSAMSLFWSVRDMTEPNGDDAAASSLTAADLKALQKIF